MIQKCRFLLHRARYWALNRMKSALSPRLWGMLCDNFNFNVVNLFFGRNSQLRTQALTINEHIRSDADKKASHKEKIKCENKKEKWFWLEQEKFTHKERNDISSRLGEGGWVLREAGVGIFFVTFTNFRDQKKITFLKKISSSTPHCNPFGEPCDAKIERKGRKSSF